MTQSLDKNDLILRFYNVVAQSTTADVTEIPDDAFSLLNTLQFRELRATLAVFDSFSCKARENVAKRYGTTRQNVEKHLKHRTCND